MKAMNLLSIIQNNPEAEVVMRSTSYDDNSFNEISVAHVYHKGEYIQEQGENFTDYIDDETGQAVVDIIVLS